MEEDSPKKDTQKSPSRSPTKKEPTLQEYETKKREKLQELKRQKAEDRRMMRQLDEMDDRKIEQKAKVQNRHNPLKSDEAKLYETRMSHLRNKYQIK